MLSTSSKPYTQKPICLYGQGIHSAAISCIDFLDEDRRIIICSEDGSIQVLKVDTGQVVGGPWTDAGSGAVHAMAVSPNHMEIVTGSQDGRIRLWTLATGKMAGKWKQAHSLAILSVCWSPDELHIASGSEDGTAIIWDTKQGDIVGYPIRTGHPHVYAVRYSSDGTTLVTSGYNNTITFWDVKTREVLRFVEACHASQQIHCVTWTSYDRIFLGCSNGIAQTRADIQGKVVRLGERTRPICAMVLSQDELLLVTASLDNTISLWDPKTNQSVGRPLDHPNGLRCAAFARNSRLLATGGVDKSVYIWDLQALIRDVNVTDSESGPSLGTSTAGHSLIDIDASICPASNNARKDLRHDDTIVPDHTPRLPAPFDVATNIRSASPPNPRPWDERGVAQSNSSTRTVDQVAREAFSRPRPFSRTRAVGAGHGTRENSSHGRRSRPPGQQENAVHKPVRVKDNVWSRFWLCVGCLSPAGVDD